LLVHQNLGTKPDDPDPDAQEAASCASQSDIATVDDVSTVFHSLESGGSVDSEWDESETRDCDSKLAVNKHFKRVSNTSKAFSFMDALR
jgi:hypothetical protein